MSDTPRVSRVGDKKCTRCGCVKPLPDYHREKRNKDGRRSECKQCFQTLQSRRYRTKGHTKAREYNLRRQYGISPLDYEALLASQDNGCAICGKSPELNGQYLAVDHNHTTGEIRGLLCQPCNTGIGLLNDSPSQLRLALRYLEERGHYGRN